MFQDAVACQIALLVGVFFFNPPEKICSSNWKLVPPNRETTTSFRYLRAKKKRSLSMDRNSTDFSAPRRAKRISIAGPVLQSKTTTKNRWHWEKNATTTFDLWFKYCKIFCSKKKCGCVQVTKKKNRCCPFCVQRFILLRFAATVWVSSSQIGSILYLLKATNSVEIPPPLQSFNNLESPIIVQKKRVKGKKIHLPTIRSLKRWGTSHGLSFFASGSCMKYCCKAAYVGKHPQGKHM